MQYVKDPISLDLFLCQKLYLFQDKKFYLALLKAYIDKYIVFDNAKLKDLSIVFYLRLFMLY